jgi:hypothetical protein
MMAMTTKSSTSVKPWGLACGPKPDRYPKRLTIEIDSYRRKKSGPEPVTITTAGFVSKFASASTRALASSSELRETYTIPKKPGVFC